MSQTIMAVSLGFQVSGRLSILTQPSSCWLRERSETLNSSVSPKVAICRKKHNANKDSRENFISLTHRFSVEENVVIFLPFHRRRSMICYAQTKTPVRVSSALHLVGCRIREFAKKSLSTVVDEAGHPKVSNSIRL